MSAEEGVRDLVLRHADYVNLGQPDNFARNFAPDGVWDITGVAKAEGRAQIGETMQSLRSRFEWIFQGVQGTRIVEIGSDTAKARSYVTEYGRLRGESYFLFASYHDDCVLIDDVWCFQYRKFHPLYMGSAALDAAPLHYPVPDYFATRDA